MVATPSAFAIEGMETIDLPAVSEAPLQDLIISSTISLLPLAEQARAIETAFNSPIASGEEAITQTIAPGRGRHIEAGQFMLAHRNFKPMIAGATRSKLATCYTFHQPNVNVEEIAVVKQTDAVYGGYGVSVHRHKIDSTKHEGGSGWCMQVEFQDASCVPTGLTVFFVFILFVDVRNIHFIEFSSHFLDSRAVGW